MAGFDYILNVTGDCNSVGAGVISIQPQGGTPPYTVEWVSPSLPPINIVNDNPSERTGLYTGTYVIRLNDSTEPDNISFLINAQVSSGVCASITSVSATTCGVDNGSVYLSATTYLSSVVFDLYTSGGTLINTFDSNTSTAEFTNLSAGTYYSIVTDSGGCTAKTPDFIIVDSSPLSFGLYIVPTSPCNAFANPIGKIYVTGQTGTSPYTYLWSNNATGSTVTGLTSGFYSVTVTDANGCTTTQEAFVPEVLPLGITYFSADTPSCFASDGSLTVYISGGTAPYYYSASTGNVSITYAQNYTLSGIPAGQYSFVITDAGLCQVFGTSNIQTPQSIGQVNVFVENSTCSSTDGYVEITVGQGVGPFTYTLIYPDSSNESVTTLLPSQTFFDLSSGTYTIVVSDSTSCEFSQSFVVLAENLYSISVSQTGTTCNQNNGVIYVETTTGGTEPYDYYVDDVLYYNNTSLTAVTINSLSSGSHTISVVDANGCKQTSTIFVTQSQPVNFSLYKTNCGNGNEGTISVFISSGQPPFNFQWSSNVSGNPQEIFVSNLTGGTYSLTIIDSNNCSLTRNTTITCSSLNSGYVPFPVGSKVLEVTLESTNGILQMLNDGFQDLSEGNLNCELVTADFIAQVSVTPIGLNIEQSFYTGTTLVDIPSINLWYDTVETLLLSVPGVQGVNIDPLTNQITITKDPNNTYLNGQIINITLAIEYDINC